VTTARCPACGAAVADGAPWCTLCYTDLRAPAVAPAPTVEVDVVPAQPAPAASEPLAEASRPAVASPRSSLDVLDVLDPILDAPVTVAADAPRGPATWPCGGCGAAVDLDRDACPQCGTPFLFGVDPVVTVDLPLVGPIRPLDVSKSSRVWLMIGGGLALSLVLTLVLSLIGLLL
jgi:hypothetical protein